MNRFVLTIDDRRGHHVIVDGDTGARWHLPFASEKQAQLKCDVANANHPAWNPAGRTDTLRIVARQGGSR